MYSSRVVLISLTLFLVAPTIWAADIEAGKQRAATCFACHGPEGISSNPKYPNLAGQNSEYLMKQINAFRTGDRTDPFMTPMAAQMNDADVENVAAFFADLGKTAQQPISSGGEREEITAAASKILAAVEAMYQGAASGVPAPATEAAPKDEIHLTEAESDRARGIYFQRCAGCHGGGASQCD